ncbi:MAG: hypothetical protein M1819_002367 [Sarea resinae]|nr:MAG: hypothetical protein M1819_002367 [Sarea resinae]
MADLSSSTEELKPPRKSVELEDPDSSETEEHFSDASEGQLPASDDSGKLSPVPTTRVEKVDDEPAHGEVPGTLAYDMRTQDAVPDELEVIQEGGRSRSNSGVDAADRPSTPGGAPIPTTVVEKVDPSSPSHGDIPGTAAHEIRKADAVPDLVLKVHEGESRSRSASTTSVTAHDVPIPITTVSDVDAGRTEQHDNLAGLPTPPRNRSPSQTFKRRKSLSARRPSTVGRPRGLSNLGSGQFLATEESNEGSFDAFADDFDDFEEGGEHDDFGEFDDGFQDSGQGFDKATDESGDFDASPPIASFPAVNFEESSEKVFAVVNPIISALFAEPTADFPSLDDRQQEDSLFLTERSASLWSQLVAPPPLQPPNWVRSRIRRLFLVSLGVPVDLDEILPASKQKKLVLPSTRLSVDSRIRGNSSEDVSGTRAKQANGSSVSAGSSGTRKRKGHPPPPEFDAGAAKMTCATTDVALSNLTDKELQDHVARLRELIARSGEVLEYWLKRKDGAMGDKEAFEEVIENLVKHARKIRK